jgi:hypothetical protein
MEWTDVSLLRLSKLLEDAWKKLWEEKNTDRQNMSHIWNAKLKSVGAEVVRHKYIRNGAYNPTLMLAEFVKLINGRNDLVTDSVCLNNPDRPGQFIVMKRDVAWKVMMLGLP